jgi:hypothetical protein
VGRTSLGVAFASVRFPERLLLRTERLYRVGSAGGAGVTPSPGEFAEKS